MLTAGPIKGASPCPVKGTEKQRKKIHRKKTKRKKKRKEKKIRKQVVRIIGMHQ